MAAYEKLLVTHSDGRDYLLSERIGGEEFKLRARLEYKAVAALVGGIAFALTKDDGRPVLARGTLPFKPF